MPREVFMELFQNKSMNITHTNFDKEKFLFYFMSDVCKERRE